MGQNSEKVVIKSKHSNQIADEGKEKDNDESLVFRKERKYAIFDVGFSIVENFVRSHPAMFTKPFPFRYVNNIYFDISNFQNYSDNVVGAMHRKKFRIRWYGSQFGFIEKPVLEIKIKEGLAGAKKYFPLSSFTLEDGFSEKSIQILLDQSDIPLSIKEMLRHFVPTLLNQYRRDYYLSADHKFRLTLDSKLTYTRIAKYQNYFMRKVNDDRKVIIELKYDVKYDTEFSQISSFFPFRMTKNSKYVDGIENLDLW